MRLSALAEVLSAPMQGEDVEFFGVSIDTRQLDPGQLFIALRGPNFDGHEFVAKASMLGATAALVSEFSAADIPQIKVADTYQALTDYARWHRNQFSPIVVAITGSCGKTTTRAFLERIFCGDVPVLATAGNLNNHIGVPLMLLQLSADHRYLVLELGADSQGEIKQLTALVRPQVGIITLAAPAHVETFGSLEGVAQGKGELFSGLADDGVAVINQDDDFREYWQDLLTNQRRVSFGMTAQADVYASQVMMQADGRVEFTLHCPDVSPMVVPLQFLGRHNVMNALAAAAAAWAVGIDTETIATGLQATEPVRSRMIRHRGFNGALIVDDTYNANPCSVKAAIDTLARFPGKTILVLGDMLELGASAEHWHNDIGVLATQCGVHQLYSFGELANEAARAFGGGARHFLTREELVAALKLELDGSTVVLVKGSNSLGMETIVQALT